MNAILFETVAKNGVIEVPAEFASKPLKVVLMVQDEEPGGKLAQMQALVSEGIASGKGDRSMDELKKAALQKLAAL